jgi:hypothetical protein
MLLLLQSAAVVTATGTLAATEGADAAAFTGDVLVQGSLTGTEGADTGAFTGDVLVQGSFSGTEGADVAALAGDVIVQGSLSGTEGADAGEFTGSVANDRTGTLDATEGADTASFAGNVPFQPSRAGGPALGPQFYPRPRQQPRRETDDERRARVFAEMVEDLEAIGTQPAPKAVAKVAKAVKRIAAQDPSSERQEHYKALQRSLEAAQRRDEADVLSEIELALSIAYRAEQTMLARVSRDEDAVIAILLCE